MNENNKLLMGLYTLQLVCSFSLTHTHTPNDDRSFISHSFLVDVFFFFYIYLFVLVVRSFRFFFFFYFLLFHSSWFFEWNSSATCLIKTTLSRGWTWKAIFESVSSFLITKFKIEKKTTRKAVQLTKRTFRIGEIR